VNAFTGRDTFVILLRNTCDSFELPGSTEDCKLDNDEIEKMLYLCGPWISPRIRAEIKPE
jgi:TRAP-type mannitol/chloroaromatic compound transport system substrate-binding protein